MTRNWKVAHREHLRTLAHKYYVRKKDDPAFRAAARQKARAWYRRNHERALAISRRNHLTHRAADCVRKRAYYAQHKEKWAKHTEARRQKVLEFKSRALSYYSGGTPKCACCGITEIRFLCLDHVRGGGSQAKRERKQRSIYEWLMRIKKFPTGLQVLCYNCNAAKGVGDCCPVHARQSELA